MNDRRTPHQPVSTSLYGRHAAFRDWHFRLKPGDRLPRGRYFIGRQAGKPCLVMDEAWRVLGPGRG